MTTESSSDNDSSAGTAGTAPAEPTPTVFIIGAGVLGTTLAAKLARAGVPVVGVHGRRSDLSEAASAASGVLASTGDLPAAVSTCDVVILSVRDSRIPEVAERLMQEKRLRPNQVLLHTSGSLPSAEALAKARGHVLGVGALHPLISVTDAPGALENLAGAAFGLEGDEAALKLARKLVKLMGGRVLELRAETMALYHAGAVVASNYVVALADVARSLMVSAGIPEQDALPALWPLMSSAVRNLVEIGLPSALTGPVVRGDVVSVERHLEALAARSPEHIDLYRRLGREVLRIARKRVPELDDGAVERMAALFGGDAPGAAPSTRGDTATAAAKAPPAGRKKR
jgi:predicted short-subunit dehydrogenase-like oxidoreductase (DUF2520 family)